MLPTTRFKTVIFYAVLVNKLNNKKMIPFQFVGFVEDRQLVGTCLRNRETKIQVQYIKQLNVSALRFPERVINTMLISYLIYSSFISICCLPKKCTKHIIQIS